MRKDYDILNSVNLGEINATIRKYADTGWRVHTFLYIQEPSHLPGHWVVLMERSVED